MTSAPLLWQPPRPARPPRGFELQVASLYALVSDIGARHRRAALASSLSPEDNVLAHAIELTGAPIDVFVIDTGRLHAQTLDLLDAVERHCGRAILVVRPHAAAVSAHVSAHGEFGFYESRSVRRSCCHLRKVEPLARALAGRDAWLTGQRRAHSPERNRLGIEDWDEVRSIPKFNPLALWSDAAVWFYVQQNNLPVNELHAQGFASIGCEPCTRAIRSGEDPRAGRWWWETGDSKECGLHVSEPEASTPDIAEGVR